MPAESFLDINDTLKSHWGAYTGQGDHFFPSATLK